MRCSEPKLEFLPPIYPNELIHSYVARVMHFNSWTTCIAKEKLFGVGHYTPGSIVLPTALDHLASRFVDCEKSSLDLAWGHTLLPYLTAYRTLRRRHQLLNAMTKADGPDVGRNTIIPIFQPTQWRFCSHCNSEMLQQFGELYWRREHQIWISTFCTKHNSPLLLNTAKYDGKRTYHLPTLDSCPENAPPVHRDTSEKTMEVLWQLSRDALTLLNGNLTTDRTSEVRGLSDELVEKGYDTDSGKIRWNRLEGAIDHFTSELRFAFPELRERGAPTAMKAWLPRICRGNNKPHPEPILLLKQFLRGAPVSLPFGSGPWPCLNPASDHYRKNVITQVIRSFTSRDGCQARFTCSCGYVYTRRTYADGSLSPPRFRKFGPLLHEFLAKARSSAWTINQTASMLRIQPSTLIKAMRDEGISIHWSNLPTYLVGRKR